jgi:hypothetical protein
LDAQKNSPISEEMIEGFELSHRIVHVYLRKMMIQLWEFRVTVGGIPLF